MPHLTLLEKGSGITHRVEGTEVLAGRDPACGIFLEGDEAKTVSGRHARFFIEDGKWFVEDAGSRNGTYIGTRKLEPATRHLLAIGEVVGLGLTGTQLSVQEAVGRAFAVTVLESPPVGPPPALAGGTVPMRRSEALRAGIHDLGSGEEVKVVLRGAQTGARSTGQGDRITIGRALECIIRVEGESATSVSRVHSEISVVGGILSVRDGGSRHGTFINGKKIDGATPIKAGDVLMLGPGGPTFTIEEAAIASSAGDAPAQHAPAPEPDVGAAGPPGGPARSPPPSLVPKDAPNEDDVFRSELPTPAIERPAAKKPPAKSVAPPVPATPATRAGGIGRTAIWAAVLLFTTATTAIIAITKKRMDRTQAGATPAKVGFQQQSAELDSMKAAMAKEAAGARAAVDSAVLAAAPAAVIDSLRQALTDADRRLATLEDSLKRRSGTSISPP